MPSTSTTPELDAVERPQQASALPSKRGEIGFDESEAELQEVDLSSGTDAVVNSGPHPAERSEMSATTQSNPSSATAPPRASSPTSSQPPKVARRFIDNIYSRKPRTRFGGLSNLTVTKFVMLLLSATFTACFWVLSVELLERQGGQSQDASPDQTGGAGDQQMSMFSSIIFVHIAFAMASFIILVFFERILYRARVERYAFKHNGELPQHRLRGGLLTSNRHDGIPYVPWNRGPLPTYAAAMNVRGTGDVEDEIIAAPPPPAYGNTRGSVLLLSAFALPQQGEIPNSPPPPLSDDGHSGPSSRRSSWSASLRNMIPGMRKPASRPESQIITENEDAARAIALEEALAKLEDGQNAAAKPQ